MPEHKTYLTVAALIVSGVFFIHAQAASADSDKLGSMEPLVRVLNARGSSESSFYAYAKNFRGGVFVAAGDVDGDGQAEIVTAPGNGHRPEVRVFTRSGKLQTSFLAYGAGFTRGVSLSVYDLDGDGRSEIITGPRIGGGPEVRIFNGHGERKHSFFAFDKGFRGGVSISAGSFGKQGQTLIVVGAGYGSSHVRFFTPQGKYAGLSLRPFGSATHGVVVGTLRTGTERDLLLVAPQRSATADMLVFDLAKRSAPNQTFSIFGSFKGGLQISTADMNGDGTDEIIASTGPGTPGKIRVLQADGHTERTISIFSNRFRGGVSVTAVDGMLVAAPRAVALEGRTDVYKYIEVDLSDQQLRYFQEGRLIGTHHVSTGKWSTPTPIGTHAIKNKIPVAFSRSYNLYMEWWMAITPDGGYGVHALPFWKQANGAKYYEGTNHLGTPVSHGCIRQSLKDAKALFDWADIGTPVYVKR